MDIEIFFQYVFFYSEFSRTGNTDKVHTSPILLKMHKLLNNTLHYQKNVKERYNEKNIDG